VSRFRTARASQDELAHLGFSSETMGDGRVHPTSWNSGTHVRLPMATTARYTFEDEDQALRFVRICTHAHQGFAFFRRGVEVMIIDPTRRYAIEIDTIARECGGKLAG